MSKACYLVFSPLMHLANSCCSNVSLAQTSKASVVDKANNKQLCSREEAFWTVNCLLNLMEGLLLHKCFKGYVLQLFVPNSASMVYRTQ